MSEDYRAADDRYEARSYRRVGSSGLVLPAVSLGLWQNFGDDVGLATQKAILHRAFDLGVTHIDLANNYGPPPGSAETNFGRIFRESLAPYRDELILSSKAGYSMWPGPYGEWGSRKYLLASLDQSLRRMRVDYVDIFYSHRYDPSTPLEETMGALHTAVTSGRALYAGISSYPPEQTRQAAEILAGLGTRLLIHQPSYSIFDRWIEGGLIEAANELEIGLIVFSPLFQGLLTSRYLDGVPADSRARKGSSIREGLLNDETIGRIRGLNGLAEQRGQTLAQMALAWALRHSAVSSVLVGASSVGQLEDNLAAVQRLDFSAEELSEIDTLGAPSGARL